MLFTGSLLHRSEHVYTGLLHTCNSMYQNSWHRPVKIHRLSYKFVLYNNQVCNRYQPALFVAWILSVLVLATNGAGTCAQSVGSPKNVISTVNSFLTGVE